MERYLSCENEPHRSKTTTIAEKISDTIFYQYNVLMLLYSCAVSYALKNTLYTVNRPTLKFPHFCDPSPPHHLCAYRNRLHSRNDNVAYLCQMNIAILTGEVSVISVRVFSC